MVRLQFLIIFGSGDDTNSVDTGSKEEQAPTDTTVSQDNIDITIELNEPSKSNVPELYVKEIFKQKVEEFKKLRYQYLKSVLAIVHRLSLSLLL